MTFLKRPAPYSILLFWISSLKQHGGIGQTSWGCSSCLATKVFCFPLKFNPVAWLPTKKGLRNFCCCSCYFVVVISWGGERVLKKKKSRYEQIIPRIYSELSGAQGPRDCSIPISNTQLSIQGKKDHALLHSQNLPKRGVTPSPQSFLLGDLEMANYRLFPGTGVGAPGHRIQDLFIVSHSTNPYWAHCMLGPVLSTGEFYF